MQRGDRPVIIARKNSALPPSSAFLGLKSYEESLFAERSSKIKINRFIDKGPKV